MPTFDIESETDLQEVDNALSNVQREIATRFDFKGTKCEITRAKEAITLLADDQYKLDQMHDLLKTHLTRRKVDTGALEFKDPEKASGNSLRQTVLIKQGVDSDTAKKIVKAVKDAKLKVQASIQGDTVRISGKKRDDLQDAIALVRGLKLPLPLQYNNFRD